MQSLPSRTGKVMLMKGLKDVQQPSAARNEKVTENGKDVKLPSGACNETAMTRDHDVQRPSWARKNEGNILCQDAPMGTPRSGYASFSCREDTSVLPVFQDKPVSKGLYQAIILELCAGCAKLSSVCSRDGLTAVAIDHGSNKHTPRHHILNLDLSLEHSWATLREICTLHHVIWVHIAPPCGTASRARDRPLTVDEWGPRPLRSAEFPWGLPDLDGAALDRVTTANAIYWRTVQFCSWLSSMDIHWTVENPARSYMWELPCFIELCHVATFYDFDSCMHGGERLKHTSFLWSSVAVQSLCLQCDGLHEHLEWGGSSNGVFNTAHEAEYPLLLCQRLSELFRRQSSEVFNPFMIFLIFQAKQLRILQFTNNPGGRCLRCFLNSFLYKKFWLGPPNPVWMPRVAFPLFSMACQLVPRDGRLPGSKCLVFSCYFESTVHP